jgi:hypothetical protein
MDWTDRLKDWAEDAVDDGSGDGIFDKVGDFLGDQIGGDWAQDLVDAGTVCVIDNLDGTVSQPVGGVLPASSGPLSADASSVHADDVLPDGVEPMPSVEAPVVNFEDDPEPSHFDEAVAAADAVDDSVDDTFVDLG